MNIVVLKFGGSSVANNEKIEIVANKVIAFKQKFENVVVIVSAQGKTTDKLILEAKELSLEPNSRELDALLSTGEQISATKLAIKLIKKGYKSISLTGWQAGIETSEEHGNSSILNIDTKRIYKELKENKIVIITGFQGIDKNNDIETLGRGGSDTSAVAVAAALKASDCYIYSDVEGVYSADPNKIPEAKKLQQISYDEMIELSKNGAKVLHTKCVELAKKYNIKIHAKSTFNENKGTIIDESIRKTNVKSLVKNDKKISLIGEGIIDTNDILIKALKIARTVEKNDFKIEASNNKISILFENVISDDILRKMHNELIEQEIK